jgi:hypothetical protein
MSRSSQRKGRNGERELRDILAAAGWSVRCKGIYEPLDLDWEGFDCEVKRRAAGMKEAYNAFANGAVAYFFRADRKEWLIVMPLAEYIHRHGPEMSGAEQ